jgi:DmsE family decaheme c-type cytochrome
VTAIFLSGALSAAQAPAQALKPGYVGSDACAACHDELSTAFQKNPHHQLQVTNTWKWKGMACEACHGPGAKHAETADPAFITNPAKLPPLKAAEICLQCHGNQPERNGRVQSAHARNEISCLSCHAMHKGPERLLPIRASDINRLCATCHTAVWTQFMRPYKHRLDTGSMSCVDCHNPHGSFLPKMLATVAGNQIACFKCHGNLRGPFTYEHPPVKTEGCWRCHEPHGSQNPRMLVRADVRFVCLECHANIAVGKTIGGVPPAFHNLASPRFQNCTICHTKIHGSFVDPVLER